MPSTVRKFAHRLNMEKCCHHDSDFIFFICFNLADNENMHKISARLVITVATSFFSDRLQSCRYPADARISVEFNYEQNRIILLGVICP